MIDFKLPTTSDCYGDISRVIKQTEIIPIAPVVSMENTVLFYLQQYDYIYNDLSQLKLISNMLNDILNHNIINLVIQYIFNNFQFAQILYNIYHALITIEPKHLRRFLALPCNLISYNECFSNTIKNNVKIDDKIIEIDLPNCEVPPSYLDKLCIFLELEYITFLANSKGYQSLAEFKSSFGSIYQLSCMTSLVAKYCSKKIAPICIRTNKNQQKLTKTNKNQHTKQILDHSKIWCQSCSVAW